ncbi:hypothetical protein PtB15_3B31 [Puccinia triticina]|nr:hypothetical protein PtB15_3B31 [Puccinia triticina]
MSPENGIDANTNLPNSARDETPNLANAALTHVETPDLAEAELRYPQNLAHAKLPYPAKIPPKCHRLKAFLRWWLRMEPKPSSCRTGFQHERVPPVVSR